MKIIYKLTFILLSYFSLTSFKIDKPHLIVGLFTQYSNTEISLNSRKMIELEDIFFNSDEFTSHYIFRNRSKNLNFAYKIYEKYEGFSKPVIIFKNYCDEKIYISFTIEKLTKKELELKLIKEYTSKNIKVNTEIIKLNRTAGPPENME